MDVRQNYILTVFAVLAQEFRFPNPIQISYDLCHSRVAGSRLQTQLLVTFFDNDKEMKFPFQIEACKLNKYFILPLLRRCIAL